MKSRQLERNMDIPPVTYEFTSSCNLMSRSLILLQVDPATCETERILSRKIIP